MYDTTTNMEKGPFFISRRDFGELGIESLSLYYSREFSFLEKIGNRDFKSRSINEFYEEKAKIILGFDVDKDFKIIFDNMNKYSLDKNKYREDNVLIIGLVDEMEERFNEQYFDESVAKELSGYLLKLKEAVS